MKNFSNNVNNMTSYSKAEVTRLYRSTKIILIMKINTEVGNFRLFALCIFAEN